MVFRLSFRLVSSLKSTVMFGFAADACLITPTMSVFAQSAPSCGVNTPLDKATLTTIAQNLSYSTTNTSLGFLFENASLTSICDISSQH
jgi:hypothetical protein